MIIDRKSALVRVFYYMPIGVYPVRKFISALMMYPLCIAIMRSFNSDVVLNFLTGYNGGIIK
jgi:hypothetical protein